MTWSPGTTVVYRYGRSGEVGFVRLGRVISDERDGLALWIAPGSPAVESVLADGRPLRDIPVAERLHASRTRRETTWHGPGIVQYVPTGRAWSLWWFFDENGSFTYWYMNL